MPRDGELLFSKYDLRSVMENAEQRMYSEIDSYDSNRLLNTSTADLTRYFVEKFQISPLEVIEDEVCVDQREAQIDVSNDFRRAIFDRSKPYYITGTEIIMEIPFNGEAELFKCQPSTFTLSPPVADVEGSILYITIPCLEHDAESIKKELTRRKNDIEEYISWINRDLAPWNKSLEAKASARIEKRKTKLLKDQGLVASLGFPMKRRSDIAVSYAAPEVRRKLIPCMPSASTDPFVPEPTLVMEEYEHILSIIKMTARMLEKSPKAFKGMEEEHLRDQFLVPLNSHYEGQATGETFNFYGKTDIMIQSEGKAIFIAECKIWRGQKALSEAIDQLLGYATWRDTKIALIIFNRNKDLSGVLSKIPETVRAHNNFKRELQYSEETGFRYILGHKDDMNRELTLTILVFEVPA